MRSQEVRTGQLQNHTSLTLLNMAITDILLRYTAHPPLTTKGSELTFTEGDANLIEIYEYLQSLASVSSVAPWNVATTYSGTTYVTYSGNLWQHVTSSSTGVTPGTNPAVWTLTSIGAISHVQNTDTALATGTANQVTAAEIKALLGDAYKTGTRASVLSLRSTASLKPGYFYYISDRRIAVQATSVNALATSGYYLAYNADYSNASAQMLVTSGDAVWGDTSSYWWSDVVATYPIASNRIGKHCIHKGLHYRNLTGSNHPTDTPDIDLVNWVVATSGHASYRREVDAVVYDIDADLIMQRADKRGNVVKRAQFVSADMESFFQFGNDNVLNNIMAGNCDISYNRGLVSGNNVGPLSYMMVNNNGANGTLTSAEVIGNTLNSSTLVINDNESYFSYNVLNNSYLTVNGQVVSTGYVQFCDFLHVSNSTFTTNESGFTRCRYINLNTVELGLVGSPSDSWSDCTFNGNFDLGSIGGSISDLNAQDLLSNYDSALAIDDIDTSIAIKYRDISVVSIGGTNTATVDNITANQYHKLVKIGPDASSTLTIDCGPGNIISLDGSTTTYTLLGANGDYMLGTFMADGFFDVIKVINF
jgi:hypothetical protein